MHGGREVIVHRKGATPAGAGVLGVIPGSMADPAFVVRGTGQSRVARLRLARRRSLHVAHEGPRHLQLEGRPAGTREARACASCRPGRTKSRSVYKDIREVMRQQADLVTIVAQFDPKIVKMCDDGSRAED